MNFEKYQRQLSLLGVEGQKQLQESSILVVGCGGIGSPVLYYLASAGCGHITIIDHDKVEESNLQRQILFSEEDIGQSKALIAKDKLSKLNSEIVIKAINEKLTLHNAKAIIQNVDIVVDGSDNFETRYLVNDICCFLKKPFVSASVLGEAGHLAYFDINHGCYRCFFQEPPPKNLIPNCAEAGVIGAVVGAIGSLATAMIINVLTNQAEFYLNKLFVFDTKKMELKNFRIEKRNKCFSCCLQQIEEIEMTAELSCIEISVEDYMKNKNDWYVLDVREDWERAISKLDDHAHIPIDQLEKQAEILPKEKVLVYCQLGGRSKRGVNILKSFGIDAYSLAGGMNAFEKQSKNAST